MKAYILVFQHDIEQGLRYADKVVETGKLEHLIFSVIKKYIKSQTDVSEVPVKKVFFFLIYN